MEFGERLPFLEIRMQPSDSAVWRVGIVRLARPPSSRIPCGDQAPHRRERRRGTLSEAYRNQTNQVGEADRTSPLGSAVHLLSRSRRHAGDEEVWRWR